MQTSTHGLTLGEREVRKEFVADHELQAEREWACLTLLAEHAPGLAPRPLRREDGETPVIVMERIPGEPLAPRPLSARQTLALGASLRRLYDVPPQVVREAGIGPRNGGAADPPAIIHARLADHHDLSACRDPELVRTARAAAREWLRDPRLPESRLTVLGIADLNPANVLWDGQVARLRLVERRGHRLLHVDHVRVREVVDLARRDARLHVRRQVVEQLRREPAGDAHPRDVLGRLQVDRHLRPRVTHAAAR